MVKHTELKKRFPCEKRHFGQRHKSPRRSAESSSLCPDSDCCCCCCWCLECVNLPSPARSHAGIMVTSVLQIPSHQHTIIIVRGVCPTEKDEGGWFWHCKTGGARAAALHKRQESASSVAVCVCECVRARGRVGWFGGWARDRFLVLHQPTNQPNNHGGANGGGGDGVVLTRKCTIFWEPDRFRDDFRYLSTRGPPMRTTHDGGTHALLPAPRVASPPLDCPAVMLYLLLCSSAKETVDRFSVVFLFVYGQNDMEIIIINNKNEPFPRLLEMLLLVRWFPFMHTAREIGQAGQREREKIPPSPTAFNHCLCCNQHILSVYRFV